MAHRDLSLHFKELLSSVLRFPSPPISYESKSIINEPQYHCRLHGWLECRYNIPADTTHISIKDNSAAIQTVFLPSAQQSSFNDINLTRQFLPQSVLCFSLWVGKSAFFLVTQNRHNSHPMVTNPYVMSCWYLSNINNV